MQQLNVLNNKKSLEIMQERSIEQAIDKAKSGDPEGFSEIYNLFFEKIYKFVFFRVNHKEIAEDLTEDVFVKIFLKLKVMEDTQKLQAWIYTIARNTIIDYYRSRKTLVDIHDLENTLEYESNIVDIANANIDQKRLLKLIKHLSAEQQLVIRLRFLEDLEIALVAELLNKSQGTVRVIQHRALEKLKNLADEGSV